jgi:hypothetical protein
MAARNRNSQRPVARVQIMQPIIESLEARALLSANVDNLIFPPPLPASAGAVAIHGLNGELLGTAQLSNGILTVTGTAADDELYVQRGEEAPLELDVRFGGGGFMDTGRMGVIAYHFADVKGICLRGEGGNDMLFVDDWMGAVNVPVTLDGGAGNDVLFGPDGSNRSDGRALPKKYFSDMPTTLLGGEGNDTISGGLGDDLINGGGGHDQITTWMGHDIVQEDSPAPSTVRAARHRHARETASAPVAAPDSKHGARGKQRESANDFLRDHLSLGTVAFPSR